MSEPAAVLPEVGSTASPERKAQVEALVTGIFQHMEYPARLELKDMPDGGIGVAVHFSGDLPGITVGKARSWLVDCVQFLVNKAVNRPNVEKRWVSLGVNTFPEPRPERGEKPVREVQPPTPSAPQAPRAAKPPKVAESAPTKPQPRRSGEADERTLEVKDDPAFSKLFTALAEKSVKTGRLYAVMSLSADDRARALKAVNAVKGVAAKTEGEGHWRRVTLTPEKLTPMPSKRQVMPDYDDEEE